MLIAKHGTVQNSEHQIPSGPRYARAKGACIHFQIARSTLWLWVKARPGFPKPLKAGLKVTLFDLHAIEAFLRSDAAVGGKNDKPY